MCWIELIIAVIFAGYCGYVRHIDKREIDRLTLANTKITELIKKVSDNAKLEAIRAKSEGLEANPVYGEDVRYDETTNLK